VVDTDKLTKAPTFYTVREAAKVLRCDAATLYREIREDAPFVQCRSTPCTARTVIAAGQAAYRYSLMSPLRMRACSDVGRWFRPLGRALVAFGWSLLSGLVRPVLVVVPLVLGENLSRVCFAEEWRMRPLNLSDTAPVGPSP
jgi:hypothetical protein